LIRNLAALGLALVLLVTSCTRSGSTSNVQPADIYAAGPSAADVRSLFGGDTTWWQGPPSFQVSPLDSNYTPATEKFSVSQEFIHVGTAEVLIVRYTVFDKTSSATSHMTAIQSSFGTTVTSPKVGDQVMYYGFMGSGAAPYVTRTYVRVGQIVIVIGWSRKDGTPSVSQLAKNASRVVAGLKNVLNGKAHTTPSPAKTTALPPPGLDVTLLGTAELPIQAWLVMARVAIPQPILNVLSGQGANTFTFGDYALNDDTHMEVTTAMLNFSTDTYAQQWAGLFSSGQADSNGIYNGYVNTYGSSPAAGEYQYFFAVGTHGAMLVCKSATAGEAATRACEAPVARTAVAWKLSLSS
jgi:hypothetical protein